MEDSIYIHQLYLDGQLRGGWSFSDLLCGPRCRRRKSLTKEGEVALYNRDEEYNVHSSGTTEKGQAIEARLDAPVARVVDKAEDAVDTNRAAPAITTYQDTALASQIADKIQEEASKKNLDVKSVKELQALDLMSLKDLLDKATRENYSGKKFYDQLNEGQQNYLVGVIVKKLIEEILKRQRA